MQEHIHENHPSSNIHIGSIHIIYGNVSSQEYSVHSRSDQHIIISVQYLPEDSVACFKNTHMGASDKRIIYEQEMISAVMIFSL